MDDHRRLEEGSSQPDRGESSRAWWASAPFPGFAIGQRALLVRTPNGNVLWDCISLLDEDTVEAVQKLGGISAIAVSHPHTVGSLVEWSHAFDYAPIYWHADNRRWVMRPDRAFEFWEGETCPLMDGITLVRCGGHFEGSTVLHWAAGCGRTRRPADRRHDHGCLRPALCQFHVQLSKHDPVEPACSRTDCRCCGTL